MEFSTPVANAARSVLPFLMPMPYGSVVKVPPTSFSVLSTPAKPARMMSSVVTASTRPSFMAETHVEYVVKLVSCTCGAFSTTFFSLVEPCTEQTFLPFRSATVLMVALSPFTRIDCPAR